MYKCVFCASERKVAIISPSHNELLLKQMSLLFCFVHAYGLNERFEVQQLRENILRVGVSDIFQRVLASI